MLHPKRPETEQQRRLALLRERKAQAAAQRRAHPQAQRPTGAGFRHQGR